VKYSSIVTPSTDRLEVSHSHALGVADYDLDELNSPDTGLWKAKVLDFGSVKYSPNKLYWLDRSRYCNHGTITGAIWQQLPSGVWAIKCDGSDDVVSVADAPSLNFGTGDFTVMLWVRTLQLAVDYPIYISKDNEVAPRSGFTFYQATGSNFVVGAVLSGGAENSVATGIAINDGVFHLIALRKTATQIWVYIGSRTTPMVEYGPTGHALGSTDKVQALGIGNNPVAAPGTRASSGQFSKALICARSLTPGELERIRLNTCWRYK